MIQIKKNIVDLVRAVQQTVPKWLFVGTVRQAVPVDPGTACRTSPKGVPTEDSPVGVPTKDRSTPIEPLITFRILFGAMMTIGVLRFAWNGWIERLYIEPQFFFKFYGFEWVQPLGETGIYLVFGIIALSAFLVMVGLFYRAAIITFFLTFTYVELLDATHYLNHYYLVCLLAFLMIFLPANRAFSLDVWRKPGLLLKKVPAWTIQILILQLTIVYVYAGIAKLNSDWLFHAMPLAAWLPEHSDMPIIGWVFAYPWVAFAFSWAGAIYDLSIAFFLLNARTRPFAYLAVVVFHTLTGLLFNIGMFPVIMIFSTLIFFPPEFHQKLLRFSTAGFYTGRKVTRNSIQESPQRKFSKIFQTPVVKFILPAFFILQLLLPFRHIFYDGNLLWTEEGYRFSWRVMLVEKSGSTRFQVFDPETGRRAEIQNSDFLTEYQEKQMSIQPDFIVQFAHFIKQEFETRHGMANPVVTVDAYIALNGRASQQFIDPAINLAEVNDNFQPRDWVIPFKRK